MREKNGRKSEYAEPPQQLQCFKTNKGTASTRPYKFNISTLISMPIISVTEATLLMSHSSHKSTSLERVPGFQNTMPLRSGSISTRLCKFFYFRITEG